MIRLGHGDAVPHALGEAGGRALIADALGYRLRGAPTIMGDSAASWSPPEQGLVCWWLRDMMRAACAALDVDPAVFVPAGKTQDWYAVRAWELAHLFLADCWPSAEANVIEICCRRCLTSMTVGLGRLTAEAVLMEWKDDPAAEAHIVSGGPIPFRRRQAAAAPAPGPMFTPAAPGAASMFTPAAPTAPAPAAT